MSEHIHDATVPVCSCGHRWTHYAEYAFASGPKRVYTSHDVVTKFTFLYGGPSPFKEVSEFAAATAEAREIHQRLAKATTGMETLTAADLSTRLK